MALSIQNINRANGQLFKQKIEKCDFYPQCKRQRGLRVSQCRLQNLQKTSLKIKKNCHSEFSSDSVTNKSNIRA